MRPECQMLVIIKAGAGVIISFSLIVCVFENFHNKMLDFSEYRLHPKCTHGKMPKVLGVQRGKVLN